MPTLEELKSKWFLDVSPGDRFPPQVRHPHSRLQPFTDGNLVVPIIDGAPFMAEFYQRAEAILSAPDPSQHELWLSQWKLQAVKLLGETGGGAGCRNRAVAIGRSRRQNLFLGQRPYRSGSGHPGLCKKIDRRRRSRGQRCQAAPVRQPAPKILYFSRPRQRMAGLPGLS